MAGLGFLVFRSAPLIDDDCGGRVALDAVAVARFVWFDLEFV